MNIILKLILLSSIPKKVNRLITISEPKVKFWTRLAMILVT